VLEKTRMPGTPRGTPSRCTSPRHDSGRRRAIGAVAVLQSTFSRPRRWCDAREPPKRRRLRRPVSPDASQRGPEGRRSRTPKPRPFRKKQAPSLQNYLCFREGGRCAPPDSLPLTPITSRKRNHRLATLRQSPRHDLAPSPPHFVTLSGAATEAAQSKGPPMERGASSREARDLTCGDLSTRSRTLSLKVTWLRDMPSCGQPPAATLGPRRQRSPTSCIAKSPISTLKVGPAPPYRQAGSAHHASSTFSEILCASEVRESRPQGATLDRPRPTPQ